MNDRIEVRVGDTWERKRNGKRVVITSLPDNHSGDVSYLMSTGKQGYTWGRDFHNTFRFVGRENTPAEGLTSLHPSAETVRVVDIIEMLSFYPPQTEVHLWGTDRGAGLDVLGDDGLWNPVLEVP
jgi:hypothetical protein